MSTLDFSRSEAKVYKGLLTLLENQEISQEDLSANLFKRVDELAHVGADKKWYKYWNSRSCGFYDGFHGLRIRREYILSIHNISLTAYYSWRRIGAMLRRNSRRAIVLSKYVAKNYGLADNKMWAKWRKVDDVHKEKLAQAIKQLKQADVTA